MPFLSFLNICVHNRRNQSYACTLRHILECTKQKRKPSHHPDITGCNDNLGSEQNSATSGLDLLLGILAKVSGLNNDRDVRKSTLAQNLEITQLSDINDGSHSAGVRFALVVHTLGHHAPQAVNVDGGAVGGAALQVEVAHADLTEVTRVELIEVDSMVVLATGVTATTRVAPVLADTTVTSAHVASLLSVVVQSGGHG